MGSNFIAVPAQDIENFLRAKGYTPFTGGSGNFRSNEVVYHKRSSQDPNLMVKCYTSVRHGQTAVRAAGRDAIRVVVVWDNGQRSFGVGKFQPVFRVHSVQSVLDRLELRLQEAVLRAKEWLGQQDAKKDATAKNAAAERERLQEQEAYKREMETEAARNVAAGKCPDGCCGGDCDPSSEPPEPGPVAFEQYAASLNVPF